MKIAFIYDRVNKFGGAEQVLLGLNNIWPTAPLYTAFYSKSRADWAHNFTVHPAFSNAFPYASTHHELYPWLAPFAFESFSFDSYDVAISVTSAEAKSIITKPETCHICYCLTPTRYLWSGYATYKQFPGIGPWGSIASSTLSRFLPEFQKWDKIASSRPDYYIAISSLVKKRIENFYQREVSAVIHPPVRTDVFDISTSELPTHLPKEYYLVVSRLVGYKRIDLLIESFNQLHKPLVVIGDGHELNRLQSMAGRTIQFVTKKLTDAQLAQYYQHCIAFVYAAEEDFGIVAAEAQSCGKAVVAYKHSGVSDIVSEKTGILFEHQTVEDIIEAIRLFESKSFDASQCRSQALQFSSTAFQQKMQTFVEKTAKKYLL